jgi:HSP20 family protein
MRRYQSFVSGDWPFGSTAVRALLTDGAVETPPLDIEQTDDALVVTVDVPGYDREDISLAVDGRSLRIDASRTSDRHDDRDKLVHERQTTQQSRVVPLPTAVESEGASATYRNGVLSVTLPRAADGAHCIDIE